MRRGASGRPSKTRQRAASPYPAACGAVAASRARTRCTVTECHSDRPTADFEGRAVEGHGRGRGRAEGAPVSDQRPAGAPFRPTTRAGWPLKATWPRPRDRTPATGRCRRCCGSLVGGMGVRTIAGTCESALEGKGVAMTLLPTVFNISTRLPRRTLLPAPVLNTSVRLLTGELDENRAIDYIADLIPRLRHKLEKEYSLEWLETVLKKGLREGRLLLTIRAVQAADAGDEICDAALRTVFAEMVDGALPKRGRPGHLQVWAYGQRAVLQPPHKRPQGHRWHDHWIRNIQICNLIYFVWREFGVKPTRNREARRANRAPSAISIVVKALAREKIYLKESNVQENLWNGLPGRLVCEHHYSCAPSENYTCA
jgi:hypothetical protein